MNKKHILLIAIFIAIVILIIFIVLRYRKSNLKYARFIDEPIENNSENDFVIVAKEDELPSIKNGRQFAMSFWIYVDSLPDNNHQMILLMAPGASESSMNFKDSSLVCYMKKSSNEMYIKLRNADADKHSVLLDMDSKKEGIDGKLQIDGTNSNTLFDEENNFFYDMKVDYVQLQKWVNIIINVKSAGFLELYVDGELHTTFNTSNKEGLSDMSKIVTDKRGSIVIGSHPLEGIYGFKGIISNLQFFNYSINNSHVKTLYTQGPTYTSVLKHIGLPLYGLRNPVYRIDKQTPQTI